nr:gamma-glutamyl-gamma-aminobutyrate hydrolase family protein [Rickettsiaceae bacterium]
MKKPVIAITLDYHTNINGFFYSEKPWYALRCDYSRVVASLGAIPILISYESDLIDDILNIADGLIIPGGDYHIPGSFYGNSDLENEYGKVRAEYEIALLRNALDRNMPVLGICNGMQLMNVCFGGSLKYVEGHLQPSPKSVPY